MCWGCAECGMPPPPPPRPPAPLPVGALHRGPQRSGVGLPLRSSCARLHTAFIALSVHCVFGIAIVRWLSAPLPSLPPRLGQETRAYWFWALSPGHTGSWLLFVLHVGGHRAGCACCRGPHLATHLSLVLFTGRGRGGVFVPISGARIGVIWYAPPSGVASAGTVAGYPPPPPCASTR